MLRTQLLILRKGIARNCTFRGLVYRLWDQDQTPQASNPLIPVEASIIEGGKTGK